MDDNTCLITSHDAYEAYRELMRKQDEVRRNEEEATRKLGKDHGRGEGKEKAADGSTDPVDDGSRTGIHSKAPGM